MLMIVMNDASSKASIFLNTLMSIVLMKTRLQIPVIFPSFFMVYFTMMSKIQTLKTAWPVGRSVYDDLERV